MHLPWKQPNWLPSVAAWVESELAARGIRQTGELEQVRERAWSTVYRVPTEQGTLYFKSLTPSLPHEPPLVAALAERFPDAVPEVVAKAENNPWFIMRDAGRSLRGMADEPGYLDCWKTAVRQYARLQRGMASEIGTLVNIGVLDRRLAVLPDIYAEFVADSRLMQGGDDPEGLRAVDVDALRNGLPRFERLCRRLAEAGIPETVEHNDLHDNNIFVSGDSVRIGDWGDSGIAHPFFSLTVVLRSTAYTRKLPDSSPALADIRRTYLSQWTEYAPLERLETVAKLANVLCCISRAQTWLQAGAWVEEDERGEYYSSARGWLKEYLQLAEGLAA